MAKEAGAVKIGLVMAASVVVAIALALYSAVKARRPAMPDQNRTERVTPVCGGVPV